MALATYSDLKTSAENWLARSNPEMIVAIPDAITMAEAEINDLLRTEDMEQRATTPTVIGQAYYPVPENSDGLRRLVLVDKWPLEAATPGYLDKKYIGQDAGPPCHFAVEDKQYRLAPTPDAIYTIEVSYYKQVPNLTDLAPTNWLLTSRPQIYLSGTLMSAFMFAQRFQEAAVWEAKFQTAISRLQSADRFNRFPGPYSMKHDYSTNDGRP